MQSEILKPIVVLVAWTLVMLAWMMATRLPAMKRAGIDLRRLVGTTGADGDRALPPSAQWKAHNYNHLLEQPTAFYAVAIVVALSGAGPHAGVELAWCYVGLRIAHSLVQATTNRVAMRFVLFLLSSAVLVALTVRAAIAVFDPASG